MDSENPLGEFLRARRDALRPEDVGISDLGRRRVPGLRRDELAMLAGISSEYYVRLEQGRDQHPSTQVVDALARALELDEDATRYLHELARPLPSRKRARRNEKVQVGVLQLLESWELNPAYVHGPLMDVLAANRMAVALSPMFQTKANLLRQAFLDPCAKELLGNWKRSVQSSVDGLREMTGPGVDDPHLNELVGELSVKSAEFRELWSRHEVRPSVGGGLGLYHHPQVGELELRHETLRITGTEQTLVVYHAAPGSDAEQRLSLLASIAAEFSDTGTTSDRSTRSKR